MSNEQLSNATCTSTVARKSIEPGRPSITPPASVSSSPGFQHATSSSSYLQLEDPNGFQPYQMLMEAVITIEYGEEVESQCVVHQGLICCHSPKIQQWCTRAKALREKHDKCEAIAQQLTLLSSLAVTETKYEENEVQSKIVPLITHLDNHFPLPRYQPNMTELIKKALASQIADKHVKSSQQTPKTSTKTYHDLSLPGRLDLLDWQGMTNMIERLGAALSRLKALEKGKGKDDPVKAMAQNRIVLPGVSGAPVKSLVAWIYRGELHYQGAEHLYATYELAIHLQVDALAEKCLSQLFITAFDIIQETSRQGKLLGSLLGFPSAGEADLLGRQRVPSDNTVEVIFKRVLTDPKPPSRLLDLVVNTMASKLDSGLWVQIQDTISHPVALRLIDAMLQQKQVKGGRHENRDMAIKLEDHRSVNATSHAARQGRHQSA